MVRKKNRYILAEILYNHQSHAYALPMQKIYHDIKDSYIKAFGDYGFALVKSSLSVRYCNEETKMILIRIRRGAETQLSNTLAVMTKLCDVPMKMVTVHISGSIRCAQKYWIRYKRRQLNTIIKNAKTAVERQDLISKMREAGDVDFSSFFTK